MEFHSNSPALRHSVQSVQRISTSLRLEDSSSWMVVCVTELATSQLVICINFTNLCCNKCKFNVLYENIFLIKLINTIEVT
jgi:hypothetical protein